MKSTKLLVAVSLLVCLSMAMMPTASAAYSCVQTRYDCSTGTCVKVGGTCSNAGSASKSTASYTYSPIRYVCSGGTCVRAGSATTSATAPSSASTGVNYTPVSASAQELELLAMVNAERAAKGLNPYVLDSALSGVAKAKCSDMIEYRYFAHGSPRLGSLRDMLTAAGISYRGAGENIARYGSVQKAFAGLMSSVGHRNNILSKAYTHIGLSVCRDTSGNYYIVQTFISK